MTELHEDVAENGAEELRPSVSAGRSYLVVDCGNSNTVVTLYDRVEGSYRLIARGTSITTSGPPWFDLSRGLLQAVNQISDATGRVLLSEQGNLIRPSRPDGNGIDEFGAVVSVGDPLRVLVVGLLEDFSVASAQHVVQTVNANQLDCFSLTDGRDKPEHVLALINLRPELILLTGGTDGGADRQLLNMLDTLAMGISLFDNGERPSVVYAGNARMRPKVKDILDEITDVYFVENVLSSLESEQINDAVGFLAEMFLADKAGTVPGIDGLFEWSTLPLKSTAHAFAGMGEYIASLKRGRVVCLDVGSSHVTVVSAESENTEVLIAGDLGLGRPVINLQNKNDISEISRWIDESISESEIEDFLGNKAVQPNTIPLTETELQLEMAIVRRIVQLAINKTKASWNWSQNGSGPQLKQLLLHGNSLANASSPRLALLAVLDVLQPTGVFEVVADSNDVLPAMGLLATENPELVVQVLNHGALNRWGWVVAPVGRGRKNQTVLTAIVQSKDMEGLPIEVSYGSLGVLPIAIDKEATITLKPASGFDIGFGRGKSGKIKIRGGAVGLVIDARGRPLPSPTKSDVHRKMVQQWSKEIAG